MITNFSIEPKKILEQTFVYIDLENNEFPLMCIDRDSYIVSSSIESGINLSKGGVHNLQIGKFCSLAHNIIFEIDLNHDYSNITTGVSDLFLDKKNNMKRKGQILIQNDVWIGRGSTIMAGVTIHNGAVVAANSHVTKDVPPYAVVGGNPAKIVKYRFKEEIIEKLLKISWWNWTSEKIKENSKYFNESVETFCDIFYEKALEDKRYTFDIEKLDETYLYFLDLNEPFSISEKVIKEFTDTFKNNKNHMLLIYIDEDYFNINREVVLQLSDNINEMILSENALCNITICIDKEEKVKDLFAYADYYITNRSKNTVYYSCLADNNKVKIISGVDIPIF